GVDGRGGDLSEAIERRPGRERIRSAEPGVVGRDHVPTRGQAVEQADVLSAAGWEAVQQYQSRAVRVAGLAKEDRGFGDADNAVADDRRTGHESRRHVDERGTVGSHAGVLL